mmetsp:Transcript_44097/g.104342  ORF Transcript_44097/g.104342 Transcript_44097/m.104342 type:complete len:516 (-) Transcript_44097:78-1625(-)|eukprot:CAMPEP_0178448754 /NCGR_PEP_ID=MMETSP0689_2-20121128/42168_1 /TAXON_ID=160604 /ORGANISM="Amphidinium massartii, Strain CS-259" /LENGTH=515 /DNA_ID=CAMNT_0020073991 /DNA_START=43 /DNA_END=1590 /DNA_ORIENTATION=-
MPGTAQPDSLLKRRPGRTRKSELPSAPVPAWAQPQGTVKVIAARAATPPRIRKEAPTATATPAPPAKVRRTTRATSASKQSVSKVQPKSQTPAAGGGEAAALVPSMSPLERASVALRPGEHKGQLPCREEEWLDVTNYLRAALRSGGTNRVLYISGMPGTGKTALVLEAFSRLLAERIVPQLFQVHVNAMRLGSPHAVFAAISQQLGLRAQGANVSPGTARAELNNFFSTRPRIAPPIVLLIDEIDHLVTPNQAVLYHIFDWLGLNCPGLIMVAISNTMDLPERLLPRVASRFGIVRIDFQPYNRDQLIKILKERLRSHNAQGALTDDTIRLAAARVAAGAGDLRKALQLCQQAVEICSSRTAGEGPVSIIDLQCAEKDLLHANPVAQAIGGLSVKYRRFLTAVLVELRKRDADVVPLRKVNSRYAKLCMDVEPSPHIQLLRVEEAQHLQKRLEDMSLLVSRHGNSKEEVGGGATLVLSLGAGLDIEDLSKALLRGEDDAGMRSILENEQLLPIA